MIIGQSTYNATGTYTDTIEQAPDDFLIQTTNLNVDSINTKLVQLSPITLSAVAIDVNYQWFDCDAGNLMHGDTSRDFIAPHNAFFSVIVSRNRCVDTSFCALISAVGLNEFKSSNLLITPNPASEILYINWPESKVTDLQIFNMSGQSMQFESTASGIPIRHLESGTYFLKASNQSGQVTVKRWIKH